MYAALLLLGALVWLCIAGVTGWLGYRQTRRRWVQVVVSLFVLWLPFWDVLPGLYFYYKAIREVGGVRIYKTVRAEGYLDLTATDCYSCWSRLHNSGYRYFEMRRTVAGQQFPSIEQRSGYYEYRLLARGDVRCGDFNSLPNADRILANRGLKDLCVHVTHRLNPISRYEVSARRTSYPSPVRLGVMIYTRKVNDRSSGETIAESAQIYFTSWLGRQIGLPHWQYTDLENAQHIEIRVTEVLIPD